MRALIVDAPDGYELDGRSEIIFDSRDYWEEAMVFVARYQPEDMAVIGLKPAPRRFNTKYQDDETQGIHFHHGKLS